MYDQSESPLNRDEASGLGNTRSAILKYISSRTFLGRILILFNAPTFCVKCFFIESMCDFNSKASGKVNQVNMASVEVEGRYRPNKRGFSSKTTPNLACKYCPVLHFAGFAFVSLK